MQKEVKKKGNQNTNYYFLICYLFPLIGKGSLFSLGDGLTDVVLFTNKTAWRFCGGVCLYLHVVPPKYATSL